MDVTFLLKKKKKMEKFQINLNSKGKKLEEKPMNIYI